MKKNNLSVNEVIAGINATLVREGVDEDSALMIAKHLVRAETRGYSSHGLARLPGILKSVAKANREPSLSAKTDLSGLLSFDAKQMLGIPAATRALRAGAARAEVSGAAVVGVTNFVGTTGCLGVYTAELAEAGFVGIVMCHSEFAVAPWGGRRAILGTNPISISIPAPEYPFVADVATAAWSYGALREAMQQGRSVPYGVVQTESGEQSTDPKEADRGSMMPMAGHKGYALGLAIELLCGAVLGGKSGRDAVLGSDGLMGIVIKLDTVRPADSARGDAGKLFAEIKGSPLAPGATEIRIPGEKAFSREGDMTRIDMSPEIAALLPPPAT